MDKKLTQDEILETKGRWPIFVKFCMILIVFSADRNLKDTHWTRESDHYANGVGNGIGCTYYA